MILKILKKFTQVINVFKYIDELKERINQLLDEKLLNFPYFSVSPNMIFKKFCCEKKLSFKEKFFIDLYEKSQAFINDKMDVINYLSFNKEYTYLKSLLFDEVQAMCLRFTKNPKLYENSRFMNLYKENSEMIGQIVKFYTNNSNLTEQDMKVYEVLSDEIKEIIDKFKT
jgi:hypothetical protein